MPQEILFAALIGYLLGAVPFGLVLTKLAGYEDIRKMGSGNIGATNVLRTGNKFLAFLTLISDAGKGAAAVLIVKLLGGGESALIATALCSILGHIFPVWLKFKGGKGVATTLGTLLALTPQIGVIACLVWLTMAFTFRYSSLSALIAVISTPISAFILYPETISYALACWAIAAMIWYKHSANIDRLMNGEEPKIGKKKAT